MKNLAGIRFGKILVIKPVGSDEKSGSIIWECRCDCGKDKNIKNRTLVHDGVRSCGCMLRRVSHGYKKKTFNGVWYYMIDRCYNPKNSSYKNYGKKGIGVCDEWRNNYWAFHEWMVSNNWVKGLQVDRFPDKLGDYSPNNCRLATCKQNANNKANNVCFEIAGVTKTVSEWSEIYGQSPIVIHSRLKDGWGILDALTTYGRQFGHLKRQRNLKGQFA